MPFSEIPLRERIKAVETLMDHCLDQAHDPGTSLGMGDLSYRRASEYAVIAMELRSRLAVQERT